MEPAEEPRYRVVRALSKGSHGHVSQAVDTITGRVVALKVMDDPGLAKHEALMLKHLNRCRVSGCVALRWYEVINGRAHIATDLIVSQRTVGYKEAILGLIGTVQQIHEAGLIHRDIQPANVITGRNATATTSGFSSISGLASEGTVCWLIDCGYCKSYLDEVGRHVEGPLEAKGITGTLNYVSRAVQRGHTASRRDDLESIFYVGLHWAKQWKPASHWKPDTVLRLKTALINQYQFPDIGFQDTPDYDQFRRLMLSVMT